MTFSTASSDTVLPVPSLNYRATASCHSQPRVSLKTSITHPINVNWIVPEELIDGLSLEPLPQKRDLFDIYTTASLYQHYYEPVERETQSLHSNRRGSYTHQHRRTVTRGNLALSSCPGKKVRLSGPVRGRATIDRDLDLDFQRIKSLGISMVVCCLNDEELAFLGAPWPRYCELAQRYNLQIIRIPMIEGACPETLDQMDQVVILMERHIQQGQKVLAHCRGGVGRAGLVACCWLLRTRFCLDADRAIRLVRMRRSPKAIETMQQVDFIVKYADYTLWKIQERSHLSYNVLNDVTQNNIVT